jgi:alanine racemase
MSAGALLGMSSWRERRGQPASARTVVTVHLDRLQDNLRAIRRRLRPNVKFMAVVKADGYGHGAVPVARAALAAGADALAVGSLEEAAELRHAGIAARILMLSPIDPADINAALDFELELSVFQASWMEAVRRCKTSGRPIRIHLKMDTGMGRLGMRERAEFEALLPHLRASDVRIAGVYTHFATANQADDHYVRRQFARFREMRGWLDEAGFPGVPAHCANSAAAIRYPDLALDMVRVGASLYGIVPLDAEAARAAAIRLQPTLSITTSILHVKRLGPGESVSYDRSYTARGEEWIATLPIGYADGWFRGYGGAHVLVNGQRAPIVGNICMNQTMIRLPGWMPVGTPVTLLGDDQGERITLEELAARIDTIPQQVLAMISPRLPRVYR